MLCKRFIKIRIIISFITKKHSLTINGIKFYERLHPTFCGLDDNPELPRSDDFYSEGDKVNQLPYIMLASGEWEGSILTCELLHFTQGLFQNFKYKSSVIQNLEQINYRY